MRWVTMRSCSWRIVLLPVVPKRNGNSPWSQQATPPAIIRSPKDHAEPRCSTYVSLTEAGCCVKASRGDFIRLSLGSTKDKLVPIFATCRAFFGIKYPYYDF